jgi:hypothetical protein
MKKKSKHQLFVLNKEKSLCLLSRYESISKLEFLYNVEGYWQSGSERILIYRCVAIEFARYLQEKLAQAISGDLFFDGSDCLSPSLYFDMLCYSSSKREKIRDMSKENDLRHNLYSVYQDGVTTSSSLHTDKNNNIIFEIGKSFSWLDEEESSEEELLKEEQDFLSFFDNYKPIVKEVIPLEVAKRWFKQVTKLEKLISDNTMKVCGCGCEKKGPNISRSGPKINMIYKKFR